MRPVILLFVIAVICSPALVRAQADDPEALLAEAVEGLRESESFRLEIAQSGEPYPLALTLDGVNALPASLQSAEAQYVQPDELYISARVQMFLTLSLDVYSRGDVQWISFPAGAPWIQLPAFEGFDVNRLLAPDDGIEALAGSLQDAEIVEVFAESADDDERADETERIHIAATAEGAAVSGVVFGFIEPREDVSLLIALAAEDSSFAEIEITMLETADEDGQAPSVWTIRFGDFDAPRDFTPPDA